MGKEGPCWAEGGGSSSLSYLESSDVGLSTTKKLGRVSISSARSFVPPTPHKAPESGNSPKKLEIFSRDGAAARVGSRECVWFHAVIRRKDGAARPRAGVLRPRGAVLRPEHRAPSFKARVPSLEGRVRSSRGRAPSVEARARSSEAGCSPHQGGVARMEGEVALREGARSSGGGTRALPGGTGALSGGTGAFEEGELASKDRDPAFHEGDRRTDRRTAVLRRARASVRRKAAVHRGGSRRLGWGGPVHPRRVQGRGLRWGCRSG